MNEYLLGRNWKLKLREVKLQLECELGSVEPLLLHCTAESSKEYQPIEGALCVGPRCHDVA